MCQLEPQHRRRAVLVRTRRGNDTLYQRSGRQQARIMEYSKQVMPINKPYRKVDGIPLLVEEGS
jgi:hypothetical protein